LRIGSSSLRWFYDGNGKGDVLGYEPMGIVVEVGSSVTKLKKGDRVVVPFVIACGHCFFCSKQLYACCDSEPPPILRTRELKVEWRDA
jgi:threonine dehydrogenase-like Zn-dependent dehydrogenase